MFSVAITDLELSKIVERELNCYSSTVGLDVLSITDGSFFYYLTTQTCWSWISYQQSELYNICSFNMIKKKILHCGSSNIFLVSFVSDPSGQLRARPGAHFGRSVPCKGNGKSSAGKVAGSRRG